MQIGMVGLGKMGLNMLRRLRRGGHDVVAFNQDREPYAAAREEGAKTVDSLSDLVAALRPSRAVWMMVPSGKPTSQVASDLSGLLSPGDLLIDGGNSNYKDSMATATRLAEKQIDFLDIGTSGGIWGLEVGYCMMVGGRASAVDKVTPALDTLAPPNGWAHVGPSGAGHYVKMIHNGIEYGMMAAYGEGFEILHSSQFELDLAQIANLWNQGGVVRSWLLELAAHAFEQNPDLNGIKDYVSDSGEGRWTVAEAIDLDVPAPVITLSLMTRFRSRQDESYTAQVLAALREQFGGHAIKEK
jgi:6-phosphogluconate dehydrogenase